jgi:hypothetical protein
MALSNYERVGKALDLLKEALRPFVVFVDLTRCRSVSLTLFKKSTPESAPPRRRPRFARPPRLSARTSRSCSRRQPRSLPRLACASAQRRRLADKDGSGRR